MVTVLVADDSLFMRTFARKALSGSDYKVVGEAKTPDEAVELCGKLKPDIVLLDIVMEAGDAAKTGIDALKQIVKDCPSAKVVICSSLDQQALIASALKLGARAFLAKPFKAEELREILSVCMDLDVLLEMGNMGAGHATTALSELVQERVLIDVPRLKTGPPHLVPRIFERHDQPTTAVYMHLKGKADCDIMLAFEVEEAKKIAAMTASASSLETSPEIEKSAMEELGSIMICSFLNAMADFAGIELVPVPPQTVTDSFDTIIDNFLANQALVSDSVLIFETQFRRSGSSAEGFLLVFPSLEFQKTLINEGKKWLETSAETSNSSKLETVIRRT